MLPRLVAGFLLAHGAIHGSFLTPRPPATAGGPQWPFEPARSWVLTPLGAQPATTRLLAMALVAATIAGFALAAMATAGLMPADLWGLATALAAVASVALLVLFFHPWLVLGAAHRSRPAVGRLLGLEPSGRPNIVINIKIR